MCPPTYKFTREGDTHCLTFTATVEINGASYAGGPANSKEEAASKAGCESFQLTPTIPIPYPVLNFKLKAQ